MGEPGGSVGRVGFPRTWPGWGVFAPAMLAAACTTSVMVTSTDVYYQEGPVAALEVLQMTPPVEANASLDAMERAVMLQEIGEYAASTELLLATASALESESRSVGEAALKLAVNDGAATYRGEFFERVYLHTMALANLLALQDVHGAVAEAQCALDAIANSGCTSCRYPFTRYLAAAAFAAGGDLERGAETLAVAASAHPELRFLAAERDRLNREIVYERGLRFMAGAVEPSPDARRHLVLLLLLGRGPFKVEAAASIPPQYVVPWPRYERSPENVSAARVHIAGEGSRWSTPLTDVAALAAASLQSRLTDVLALQSVTTAAHEVAAVEVGKAHGPVAETVFRTLLASVDRADLRHWSTLPAECHVLRVPIPVGLSSAELVFTGPDGREVDREILPIPRGWDRGDLFVTRRVP